MTPLPKRMSRLSHALLSRSRLEWLNQYGIDAVLVEPPYNLALVADEHYTALRAAIRNGARQNGVPLVLRFETLQYFWQQRPEAARSQFGLNELGYRCMAEHVALTIHLSVRQPALPERE
jgi:lysophospholipase L1-like esterase